VRCFAKRHISRSRKPALSLPKGTPGLSAPAPAPQGIPSLHTRSRLVYPYLSTRPTWGTQKSHMHRFTARTLLVLLLVGTLAPLALAVSTQTSHACCLRKMHDSSPHQAEINAPYCCHHDCCRSVVSSQFAQVPAPAGPPAAPAPIRLQADLISAFAKSSLNSSHSVRGPPLC
jgi:hypothetical protein